MTNREKIIKALECCKRKDGNECKVCPYAESDFCVEDMVTDTLDMLKEQEAKNVVDMALSKDCFLIASCPKCNALLTRVEHKNYCGYCGQAVKWE